MSTVTDLPNESQTASAGPAPDPVPQQPPRRGGWRGGRIVPFVAAALLGGVAGGLVVAAFGDHDGGSGGTAATTAAAADIPASAAAPAAAAPTAGAESIPHIYRAASPGVVQINQGGAEGSGFVLDRRGDIVTNAHVVTNGGPVSVSFSSNDRVPATVVGFDNTTDVALLRGEGARHGARAAAARRLLQRAGRRRGRRDRQPVRARPQRQRRASCRR